MITSFQVPLYVPKTSALLNSNFNPTIRLTREDHSMLKVHYSTSPRYVYQIACCASNRAIGDIATKKTLRS